MISTPFYNYQNNLIKSCRKWLALTNRFIVIAMFCWADIMDLMMLQSAQLSQVVMHRMALSAIQPEPTTTMHSTRTGTRINIRLDELLSVDFHPYDPLLHPSLCLSIYPYVRFSSPISFHLSTHESIDKSLNLWIESSRTLFLYVPLIASIYRFSIHPWHQSIQGRPFP